MAIAVAVISMYVQHSSVSLRKIVWEFPGRKQWSGSEGMLAASSHLEVDVFVGDESWPRAINQGIRNQVYSRPHQSIIAKWLKQVVNLATMAWHQLIKKKFATFWSSRTTFESVVLNLRVCVLVEPLSLMGNLCNSGSETKSSGLWECDLLVDINWACRAYVKCFLGPRGPLVEPSILHPSTRPVPSRPATIFLSSHIQAYMPHESSKVSTNQPCTVKYRPIQSSTTQYSLVPPSAV